MALIVCGIDDAPEGPRISVAFRCAVLVEESGCDWHGSLARAKSAFSSTHPDAGDLMGWNVANTMGRRIVSLSTTVVEDQCRISASTRRYTVSELVVDMELTIESDDDAFEIEEVADETRDAIFSLFSRDAIDLAECSPGNGLVIASATIETAERTALACIEQNKRQDA